MVSQNVSSIGANLQKKVYHNPQIPKIVSTRYPETCMVYTRCHGTSELEHGLTPCTVDNPLAKARGLYICTDTQTLLYLANHALSLICHRRSKYFWFTVRTTPFLENVSPRTLNHWGTNRKHRVVSPSPFEIMAANKDLNKTQKVGLEM